MKDFDEFYKEIEVCFKRGSVDICPQCQSITKIFPNPYYYHECKLCGWKGDYRDCEIKGVKQQVEEIVYKYENYR